MIYFIDVKFKGLRDILRFILQSVDKIFFKEDKPIV